MGQPSICRYNPVYAILTQHFGFFNCITCYMMSALSTSQSMGLLQVIPSQDKTVRTVMASRFRSIPAATTPTRLVSPQTTAYSQALGFHSFSCTISLKPLAAKASVFNSNFVADVTSSVATEPDFTEDAFYNDFFKMQGYLHLGFVWTSPVGGASAKEMSSTRLPRRRQPLLSHNKNAAKCDT